MRAQIGPLRPPLPPIRATCTTFLDVKNDVLAHITEPSKDDYDNDVSDICDHNFGTFDDFGVKNDQVRSETNSFDYLYKWVDFCQKLSSYVQCQMIATLSNTAQTKMNQKYI